MPYSMTGYGGANNGGISVEFKTVNHRYLEFSARVPRDCLWAEEKLRTLAASKLSRGKAECFLRIDSQGFAAPRIAVDEPLAAEYVRALARLVDEHHIEARVGGVGNEAQVNTLYGVSASDFLRMPGVISLEPPKTDADALWEIIRPVAESALEDLAAMRCREGARLTADILFHLELLQDALNAVTELSPQTVATHRERIEARMRELLDDRHIDESRLLTETALFAEKIAVDEETARLAGHIDHMRQYLLQEGESVALPVGRKLDFLTQEMNREANTIGSKVPDPAITAPVLEMKSEIEKIREQVQNIE